MCTIISQTKSVVTVVIYLVMIWREHAQGPVVQVILVLIVGKVKYIIKFVI